MIKNQKKTKCVNCSNIKDKSKQIKTHLDYMIETKKRLIIDKKLEIKYLKSLIEAFILDYSK